MKELQTSPQQKLDMSLLRMLSRDLIMKLLEKEYLIYFQINNF